MNLDQLRYSSGDDSTLSVWHVRDGGTRRFLCFILEDEFRNKKVYGETRIPAGTYRLGLRTEGGHHERYKVKFPEFHVGMIQILDVPNFEYILFHIGNTDDDTAGCVICGDSATQNITAPGRVGSSTTAYKRVYQPIANALVRGENVRLTITNYDTPEIAR